MFVGVDETGKLCGTAFTEFQEKYTEHPDSHIVFKGYEVIEFYKVCEAAKKLHGQIPQLGIVHWDLTLDNKGNVIVIEANTYDSSIWLPQMAVGKGAFGDNTADDTINTLAGIIGVYLYRNGLN